MKVTYRYFLTSRAMVVENVRNTYQKGDFFCIMTNDHKVRKIPLVHIFDIVEEDE